MENNLRVKGKLKRILNKLSTYLFIAAASYLPMNNINMMLTNNILKKEENVPYRMSQVLDYKLIGHLYQEKNFGTLKHPKYQIIKDIPKNEKIDTYYTRNLIKKENKSLEEKLNEVNNNHRKIETFFKEVNELSQKYNNSNNKRSIFEKIMNINLKLSKINDNLFDTETNIEFDSLNSKISLLDLYSENGLSDNKKMDDYYKEKYGSVVNFTKKIVSDMIGSDKIFNYLKIYPINNLVLDELGHEDFLNDAIVYGSNLSYLKASLTLAHEIGHAIAQQQESLETKFLVTDLFKTSIMEEACAYCFENAFPYYVKDKQLKESMQDYLKSYNQMFISKYNKDNKPLAKQDPHELGVAIAISAISYFKDPKKAFDYLSKTDPESIISKHPHGEINNSIMNLINVTKKDYQNNLRLKKEIINKVKKNEKELSQVSYKVNKIINNYYNF